jgi:hypothetical protein
MSHSLNITCIFFSNPELLFLVAQSWIFLDAARGGLCLLVLKVYLYTVAAVNFCFLY